VYEPLGLPLGHVEEEPDERKEPDVRLGIVIGLSDLPIVLLLQLHVSLLDDGRVELKLSPPDQRLVVAVPVPLIRHTREVIPLKQAHLNQNPLIMNSNHATHQAHQKA
jgi:hypothetical protein